MVQVIWNSLLSVFFLTSAFLLIYIARKGFKAENRYGGASTLLTGSIVLFFGIYNSFQPLLPWPYNGFFIWWAVPLVLIYVGFLLVLKFKERKESNKKSSVDQNKAVLDKDLYKSEISIKMELYRKSFHIAGLLILLSYYLVTRLVNNAVLQYITGVGQGAYQSLWGPISDYPYSLNSPDASQDLTFFALWGTFAFICFPEYIRTLVGARYSLYNRLTKSVLRGKEYYSAGPHLFLVVGCTVAWFFAQLDWIPYSVAICATMIACFSDALAAVIGRRYGRHDVKTHDGSTKTIEGYLAGVGSALIFGLIFVGPIYALIGAIVFFLLDHYTMVIADNLMNPILISLAMLVLYQITGFPVGW